jgi:hypothetical protein
MYCDIIARRQGSSLRSFPNTVLPPGTELNWHPLCAQYRVDSYIAAEFTVTIQLTVGDPDRRWLAVATYLFMSRVLHRRIPAVCN